MSNIDHPLHYRFFSVEAIDIARFMSFSAGNVVKYLTRSQVHGTPADDLRKAAWYFRWWKEKDGCPIQGDAVRTTAKIRALMRTVADEMLEKQAPPRITNAWGLAIDAFTASIPLSLREQLADRACRWLEQEALAEDEKRPAREQPHEITC